MNQNKIMKMIKKTKKNMQYTDCIYDEVFDKISIKYTREQLFMQISNTIQSHVYVYFSMPRHRLNATQSHLMTFP